MNAVYDSSLFSPVGIGLFNIDIPPAPTFFGVVVRYVKLIPDGNKS
jgi:hypothetical protein